MKLRREWMPRCALPLGLASLRRWADEKDLVAVLRVEDLPPPRLAVSFVDLREAFRKELAQVSDVPERRLGTRSA